MNPTTTKTANFEIKQKRNRQQNESKHANEVIDVRAMYFIKRSKAECEFLMKLVDGRLEPALVVASTADKYIKQLTEQQQMHLSNRHPTGFADFVSQLAVSPVAYGQLAHWNLVDYALVICQWPNSQSLPGQTQIGGSLVMT